MNNLRLFFQQSRHLTLRDSELFGNGCLCHSFGREFPYTSFYFFPFVAILDTQVLLLSTKATTDESQITIFVAMAGRCPLSSNLRLRPFTAYR